MDLAGDAHCVHGGDHNIISSHLFVRNVHLSKFLVEVLPLPAFEVLEHVVHVGGRRNGNLLQFHDLLLHIVSYFLAFADFHAVGEYLQDRFNDKSDHSIALFGFLVVKFVLKLL